MSRAAKQIEPPRFEPGKELLIAGLSVRYTLETRDDIPAQWQRFGPHLGSVPGQLHAVAYGVCSNFSSDHSFDYLSGVEVSGTAKLPDGFTQLRIPARRYAVFTHHGHISTLPATIEAAWAYFVPQSKLKVADAPSFERYGEHFNHETGADTELWVPLEG